MKKSIHGPTFFRSITSADYSILTVSIQGRHVPAEWDVVEIVPPSREEPYWSISYRDGDQVVTIITDFPVYVKYRRKQR